MEKFAQGQESKTGGQLGESTTGEYSGATLSPPSFNLTAGGIGAPNGDDKPIQKKDDPLKVDKGQVTFDAEGNDTKGSTWYSRHIHWPGTDSSGVTIGRGYDMGRRSQSSILAHMKTAGIVGQQATLLASSAGKRGADAKTFVSKYRSKIGDISQGQQKKLFEIVYVEYEAKAKGRASKWGAYAQLKSDKPFMLTAEQYDALHPIIKELLVDLTYRGDYRSTGHAAYKKVNPILKSDATAKEKMEKLKTLLNNYKNSLKKGHFMIHRTNQRIALLDSGIAGSTSANVDLDKKDPKGTTQPAPKADQGSGGTANNDTPAKTGESADTEAQNNYASAKVWDKYSEQRMVGLHPSVAASARALINICDKEHGIKLRVPPKGGFRSFAEQNALKAKGASTVGGGYSFHNYGMAIDVVEIKDGAALWKNPRWNTIAAVGKQLGFEWGGDWTRFVDKPHFQMTFGYTTRQLLARKKGKDGFVDLGDRDDNALQPSDSVPLGDQKGKDQEGEAKGQTKAPTETGGRVPKGRLIGADVGLGGVNHEDDVKAVKQKLFAIGVLTKANVSQYMGNDEQTMGKLIKMYQRRIFKNTEDGLMSAGGATETRLIRGVKGNDPVKKDAVPSPKPAPKEDQGSGGTTAKNDTPAKTDETPATESQNNYASAKVWDKYSEQRMVGLHPSVAASARALINICDKEHGIKLRVPPKGGFRSFAEQNALKAKGASTVGGGYSFHNYGMAIDVVEIKDGAALWKNPRWNTIAAVGKQLGFEWGGDWTSFVDKPHFQMTFGYTTRQLLARKKGKDGFVDLGDRDDNALQPSDSVPLGKQKGKEQEGEAKGQTKAPTETGGRVPKGRLIGADVGLGGVNHEDDVKAVKRKLFAIGVLTKANIAQYMGKDEQTMGKLIKMYQRRIFKHTEDGLMSAGGTTETRLLNGVKGTAPAKKESTQKEKPSPKTASKPASNSKSKTDRSEPDYEAIAAKAFAAMDGLGTDESAVYNALAKLKKNSNYIAAFKKVYRNKYSLDIVSHIKSEFSNSWMFGNELDKALSYLKASKKETSSKKKSSKTKGGKFQNIDNVMSRDDWRTQNPKPTAANQKYEDNESGWTACKYISEKMVYRAVYEDLPDDFKRSQVIQSPGKFDYVVGGTGAGEFLSVQKEDKSKVKDIIPKQHKQSTFKTSGTANLAIDYLSSYLEKGIPVVAGVDHTFNRSLSKSENKTSSQNTYGYNEGTTDHFVTIVGQGVDSQNRRYFKWFDPGTQHRKNATSDSNKLVEVAPNKFVGKQPWGNKTYTLSMVVLFKKDLSTYEEYVKQNNSELGKLKSDFKNKKGDFAQ